MAGMAQRTELLIGEEGVERLRSASAIVCGCGAVGGYALEGLVRAGVGRIRVVDGDVFSESNLNRQILATTAKMLHVSSETLDEILDGDFDILVDAIDTVRCKTELLRRASEMRIPTFSSMGAALHTDTLAVRVAPLRKTRTCPLAASVRKALKDADTSNITCVYSEEPPVAVPSERDEHGKSVLGSLPTVPAVFGMNLANQAISYLIGRP